MNRDTVKKYKMDPEARSKSRKIYRFWKTLIKEVESTAVPEVIAPSLPVGGVKSLMKLGHLVDRVRDEAAAVLGKAAELFVRELTLRCWMAAKQSGRKSLQMNDMALVVDTYNQFAFLVDIVPPSTKKVCPK